MIRDNYPSALRGAAALQEALNLIGNDKEKTDHDMAKLIVDNELGLADLLRHFLSSIAEEI